MQMNMVKIVMNEVENDDFDYPIRQVCIPLSLTFTNLALKEDV